MDTYSQPSDAAGTLQGLATSYKTQLSAAASNTTRLCRGKIVEIGVGPFSNPAATDCNIVFCVQRMTAAGTGSAVTPVPVKPAESGSSPAAVSTWLANMTVEGTYANSIWRRPLNQHSGFHWYAPDDLGLPWPAINGAGLACTAKGADAAANALTVLWDVKFNE